MTLALAAQLEQYPRVPLLTSPTPLQHLDHLSQKLGVNFYLKRDDLTDLALGGDKPRKLEYEIAQAQAAGADFLVTCGSSQSNHARLTTAAARKIGMDCAVVLSRDQYEAFQGNLMTVYLMGAQVTVVDTEDHWDLENHAQVACDTLKAQGHNPYFIPVSGTTPHSCLGYIRGGLEIIGQLQEQDIQLDAVYTPFGTGGIFSAMFLAFRANGIECPFIGISVNRPLDKCVMNLDKWWNALCKLLKHDPNQSRGDYDLYDEFVGEEYGDPTPAGLDAIQLMAQTEGILLDPVYSGKVFSGFLSHLKAGRWRKNQNILLLHSGGVPALFAYHDVIRNHLMAQGLFPKKTVTNV
jgi:D-cysteine desulfhydrase